MVVHDQGDRLAAALRAPSTVRSYDNYDELPPLNEPEPPPPAVDWETLRADAEAIVDRAAADAETLLKQAQTSALDMIAKANARVAEIEDEARTRGCRIGLR